MCCSFSRAKYVTANGSQHSSLLLCSGWWGQSRHMGYLFEVIISVSHVLCVVIISNHLQTHQPLSCYVVWTTRASIIDPKKTIFKNCKIIWPVVFTAIGSFCPFALSYHLCLLTSSPLSHIYIYIYISGYFFTLLVHTNDVKYSVKVLLCYFSHNTSYSSFVSR